MVRSGKKKMWCREKQPKSESLKTLSPWKALWYNFLKDIWEMSQILYLSWSFHLFTQTCVILRADYWIRTVKNRLGSKLSHHKHSVFKPSLFSLQSYSCHVNIQLGVNNGVNNGPWRFLHLPAALPAAGGKKKTKKERTILKAQDKSVSIKYIHSTPSKMFLERCLWNCFLFLA